MTPSMPVVHLELHTGDQVRATAFYARLLHWRPELVRAACGSDLTLDTGTTLGGYVPFVSQAREQTTGELAHMHWLTYTEDPAGVPGKYEDGALAQITDGSERIVAVVIQRPYVRQVYVP
jgi:hypothetical protein